VGSCPVRYTESTSSALLFNKRRVDRRLEDYVPRRSILNTTISRQMSGDDGDEVVCLREEEGGG
jgi:hypothetical protein